jgi:hypothetical protein
VKRKLKKQKRNLPIKLFLLVTVVVFSLFFIKFLKPSYRWSRQTQLDVLIGMKDEYVLLVADPNKETVFLIVFPEDMLVDAFGGYGSFKIRNLHGLSSQENKPEIFTKSIEYFLGLPVDYWLDYRDYNLPDKKEEMPKFISGLINKSIFKRAGTVEMGDWLNIYLISSFLKDRHLYWQYKNTVDLGLVSQNGNDWVLKKDSWDKWAQSYLSDPGLKQEGLSLGIYNTTHEKGLASETARILSNSGFWVVKVGNDKNDETNCRVEVKLSDLLSSKTLRRIEKIINCPVEVVSEKNFPDFTDINIYLGDGYLSELKKPT